MGRTGSLASGSLSRVCSGAAYARSLAVGELTGSRGATASGGHTGYVRALPGWAEGPPVCVLRRRPVP